MRRFDLRLTYFDFTFHRPSVNQFYEKMQPDSLALPAALSEALDFAIHFTASMRNAPIQNLTVKLGTEPLIPPPERKHIFQTEVRGGLDRGVLLSRAAFL